MSSRNVDSYQKLGSMILSPQNDEDSEEAIGLAVSLERIAAFAK